MIEKYENRQGVGKKSAPKPKTKEVEFIKSPTGAYKLAYSVGDKAKLSTKLANELIKNGFAK